MLSGDSFASFDVFHDGAHWLVQGTLKDATELSRAVEGRLGSAVATVVSGEVVHEFRINADAHSETVVLAYANDERQARQLHEELTAGAG